MIELPSHGSLYQILDKDTKEYLFRVGVLREYRDRDVIFLESDPAHHFYLIIKGCVKISRLDRDGREVVIAFLCEGNFFGDIALLDGFPRSADAYSEGKSSILSIREEEFFKLLETNPRIAIELLKELAHRIRNSDSQIKGLSLLNARGKVASALLRWARNEGVLKKRAMEITWLPKQKELANYVGLSRETFNRIFREFEKEGFITKKPPHTFMITNFPAFNKLFSPFF